MANPPSPEQMETLNRLQRDDASLSYCVFMTSTGMAIARSQKAEGEIQVEYSGGVSMDSRNYSKYELGYRQAQLDMEETLARLGPALHGYQGSVHEHPEMLQT